MVPLFQRVSPSAALKNLKRDDTCGLANIFEIKKDTAEKMKELIIAAVVVVDKK